MECITLGDNYLEGSKQVISIRNFKGVSILTQKKVELEGVTLEKILPPNYYRRQRTTYYRYNIPAKRLFINIEHYEGISYFPVIIKDTTYLVSESGGSGPNDKIKQTGKEYLSLMRPKKDDFAGVWGIRSIKKLLKDLEK